MRQLSDALAADRMAAWEKLTPDQQTELKIHPEVGGMDGVPVAVRDEINRAQLPFLIYGARQAIADLEKDPASDKSAISSAERILAGYEGVQNSLSNQDLDRPPILLMKIAEDRAILALGNPDHQQKNLDGSSRPMNVVTYLPGMQADLSKIAIGIERGTKVREAANMRAPEKDTVVLIDYDYEIPATLAEAKSDVAAVAGAPGLRDLQLGLRATYNGDGAQHQTVIGYSYGSRVVGESGRARPETSVDMPDDADGLAANMFIALGSPGTGLPKASDMRLAGKPGGKANVFAGNHLLDVFARTPAWIHGGRPTKADYGATVLKVPFDLGRLLGLASWPGAGAQGYKSSATVLDRIHVDSYFAGPVLGEIASIVTNNVPSASEQPEHGLGTPGR